jgi:tetratricopeptide (TPR) repeat protein
MKTVIISIFTLLINYQILADELSNFQKASDMQSKGYLFEAIKYYELGLKADPKNHKMASNLAVLYYQVNNKQLAYDLMLKSLKDNPFSMDANFNIALMYKKDKQFTKASRHFEIITKLHPSNFKYHLHLAQTYKEAKNWKKAVKVYEDTIKLNPNNQNLRLDFAQILNKLGQKEYATAQFKAAIDIDPEIFKYHLEYALFLSDNKFFEKTKHLKKAIELNPKHIQARYHLALLLETTDSYAAIEQYQAIININPLHFEAHFRIGEIYMSLQKDTQAMAMAMFDKSIEINSKREEPYIRKAELYNKQSRFDLAAKQYYKIITFNPKYSDAYFLQGKLYEKVGDKKAAEKSFLTANKYNPLNRKYYDELIQFYSIQKRWDKAGKIFHKYLSYYPNDNNIKFQLGKFYYDKLGNDIIARSYWRTITKKYSNYDQVLKMMIRSRNQKGARDTASN